MSAREAEFAAELGARLRLLREDAGKRQDDIAQSARAAGLPWARSSVAALEAGSRRLTLLEWLALPGIYGAAPESILGGINVHPGPPASAPDETDWKIANRLGVTPERVADIALGLWGRSAAAERDARAGAGGGRAKQAVRGHVTRVLITELADAIAATHLEET